MSILNIICGPVNSEKRRGVFDLCTRALKRNEFQSFLYLAPSRRYARSVRRELIRCAGIGHAISPHVMNFSDLVASLAKNISHSQSPASTVLTHGYLRHWLGQHKRRLGYLRISDKNPPSAGLVRNIFDIISDLQQEMIDPEHIAYFLNSSSVSAHQVSKMRDLQLVYSHYLQWLDANSLIDEQRLARVMMENLDERLFREVFPRVKRVIVDGYDEFPKVMKLSLEKIFSFVETAHVILDYEENRPRIYDHLEPTVQWLENLGAKKIYFPCAQSGAGRGFISRNLFREKVVDKTESPQNWLDISPRRTRADEVRYIARTIKRIAYDARGDKRPFDLGKVCVTFANPEQYSGYVENIFDEYGIPYYSTIGVRIIDSCLVEALLLFLRVARDDYDVASLVKLLSSPVVNGADAERMQNASMAKLVGELSAKYIISSGKDNWLSVIEKEIAATRDENPCQLLERLRGSLTKIFDVTEVFLSPQTIDRFSASLHAIAAEFSLVANMKDVSQTHGNVADLHKEYRAFAKFFAMVDEIETLRGLTGEKEVAVDEFLDLLGLFGEKEKFYPEPERTDCVQVLGRLEWRGLDFDYLFLGGMNDGVFPLPPSPPFLLDSRTRERFGLKSSKLRIVEDRFLFYQMICLPNVKLFMSYPVTKNGDSLLPSQFIENVQALIVSDAQATHSPPQRSQSHEPICCDRVFQTHLAENISEAGYVLALIERYIFSESGVENREWIENVFHNIKIAEFIAATGEDCEYGGVITDDFNRSLLSVLTDGRYSPSSLEEYSKCPFNFFCKRLLHIEEPQEFYETIPPADRGALYHSILFRFYTRMKREEKIPITDELRDYALEVVFAIAYDELNKLRNSALFVELEKEKLMGTHSADLSGATMGASVAERSGNGEYPPRTRRYGILRRFIENEIDSKIGDEMGAPVMFERTFGSPEDPFSIEYDGRSIGLTGKIDRVEVADKRLWVVDYKTGSRANLPTENDFLNARALQLAIYVWAAKEFLNESVGGDYTLGGADYFLLKDELRNFGRQSKTELVEEIAPELPKVIHTLVNAMAGGWFKVNPSDEKICEYCSFQKTCRSGRKSN